MIRPIKGALLLRVRGRKPVDIKTLQSMLSRLSASAVAAGTRLQSPDLNPVFAMTKGKGAFAVDAIIRFRELMHLSAANDAKASGTADPLRFFWPAAIMLAGMVMVDSLI